MHEDEHTHLRDCTVTQKETYVHFTAVWFLGSQCGFESRLGHGCLSLVFICCVVLCAEPSGRAV
jgi:hypothetical protein